MSHCPSRGQPRSLLKQDLPAELSSRWNTRRKRLVCFTRRRDAIQNRERLRNFGSLPYDCQSNGHINSAAVVFEEAARLSHQYGQRWTMASALTPKAPAQASVSPKAAQTHCLSNRKVTSYLVPCLKELNQYNTAFESEDYSLLFDGWISKIYP